MGVTEPTCTDKGFIADPYRFCDEHDDHDITIIPCSHKEDSQCHSSDDCCIQRCLDSDKQIDAFCFNEDFVLRKGKLAYCESKCLDPKLTLCEDCDAEQCCSLNCQQAAGFLTCNALDWSLFHVEQECSSHCQDSLEFVACKGSEGLRDCTRDDCDAYKCVHEK